MHNLENFKPDLPLLEAKLYHDLKNLHPTQTTLSSEFLELALCDVFSMTRVGGSNDYADGITDTIQASIKTRKIAGQARSDFQSNPGKFLSAKKNKKTGVVQAGVEIVQRRQALDFDESTASANDIGAATLAGFRKNVEESQAKYKSLYTAEIVAIHGRSAKRNTYMLSLFWDEYKFKDPATITWTSRPQGIDGYNSDGIIVASRESGNAKRESTCFCEYKDLTKYAYSAKIEIPIPDPWPFDKDQILAEISNRRNNVFNDLFQS